MLDFIPNALALCLTILFPTYASYKALTTHDPALLTPWLTYFLTLSLVSTAESLFSFILAYLPFYAWIRLVLHVYLLLPGEHQGAVWIYATYIRPFLVEHDAWIEGFISDGHDRAKTVGLEYLKRVVSYIRALLLGEAGQTQSTSSAAPSTPKQATPPSSSPIGQAGQNYAQSLLARFSIPSARGPTTSPANQPQPSVTPTNQTDIYALFSSALAAATSLTNTNPTNPPPSQPQPSLIPPILSTPQEKLTYITAQTARLRALLGAFDTQAAALTSDSTAGGGVGEIKKSASVGEFEEIRHGDAVFPTPSDSLAAGADTGKDAGKEVKRAWGVWGWGGGSGIKAVPAVSLPTGEAEAK